MMMMNETTIEQRNTKLFNEIAEVMDLKPWSFDQATWGHFLIEGYSLYEKLIEIHGLSSDEASQTDEKDVLWMDVKECGTSMCVAGHAANLTGWHPTMNQRRTEYEWHDVSKEKGALRTADGVLSVEEVATNELGINEHEAGVLFDGNAEWTSDIMREFGKGESIMQYGDDDG